MKLKLVIIFDVLIFIILAGFAIGMLRWSLIVSNKTKLDIPAITNFIANQKTCNNSNLIIQDEFELNCRKCQCERAFGKPIPVETKCVIIYVVDKNITKFEKIFFNECFPNQNPHNFLESRGPFDSTFLCIILLFGIVMCLLLIGYGIIGTFICCRAYLNKKKHYSQIEMSEKIDI